jgi:hypothetical protein
MLLLVEGVTLFQLICFGALHQAFLCITDGFEDEYGFHCAGLTRGED